MEQLECTVEGTIYRNDENSYSVVSVRVGRAEHVVTGTMPRLAPGEQVIFEGEWTSHPQYGDQFRCQTCHPQKPTTLLGIERFLGSGLIRGIGPTTAKVIVRHFGEETLEVLSEHPERLQEIPGMGKKRWRAVAENYREQAQLREAMVFLRAYGVPAALSVKISRLYGDRTADVVRTNPYRLCTDIEGVGFLTADRIGATLGIARTSPERIGAALRYLLQESAAGLGHVYLPIEELISRACDLLDVDAELVEREVTEQVLRRDLVMNRLGEETQIWLPAFESAEREVASRLLDLMASRAPDSRPSIRQEIDLFENHAGIEFSAHQREAIRGALDHGVLVITGGPGTGKTTIINCIISLLREEGEVLLCAPTGRAAKRMTEATGRESKTIHRLLEYGGEEGTFGRNAENTLEADCVIVDEASMIDLMLMRSLLRAVEPGTRLILVGDSDQLPSVGAGNVLGDILASGVIPAYRLTDIYRQSENSQIVTNAHRINHGEMPLLNGPHTDSFFERTDSPKQTADTVVALAARRLPGFLHIPDAERVRAIQVLAPARKGDCGVIALNRVLQETLNPPAPDKPSITYGETVYRLGDKVMQTRNDYQLEWRRHESGRWQEGQGVFNGDVGFVTDVDEQEHTLTVTFDDDRETFYTSQQLENLDLAYALSVHKSQGSEFNAVVMPVFGGPPMLLTRNLFYTALTRARSLVMLVGQEATIRRMVENDHILRRYTSLAQRLKALAGVDA